MAGYRSKEEQVRSISKSVFITNFPDSTSSADLWKLCQTYGTVVDVFIPNRRSQAGKRFAFVRFIKVFNVERLVGNLCTLWIGKMHLQANLARFERPIVRPSRVAPIARPSQVATSFVSAVKGVSAPPISASPALVLDDSCVVTHELDNCVMGEVKQFSSINNLQILLSKEGFFNVKVAYIGGLWVLLELPSSSSKDKILKHVGVASWFNCLSNAQPDFVSRDRIVWVDIEGVPLHAWTRNTFLKIGDKWGDVLEMEECRDDSFARKRICIKTKQEDNILEKFKIIVKGKVYVIRAKELFAWSPNFLTLPETDYCSDTDSAKEVEANQLKSCHQENLVDEESDIEEVSDTYFGENVENNGPSADSCLRSVGKETSEDPFNIYDILNKQNKNDVTDGPDSSIPFPPGFTPNQVHSPEEAQVHQTEHVSSSKSSGCNPRILENSQKIDDQLFQDPLCNDQNQREGGSILELLEGMLKVGETMGFTMDGVRNDMEKIIGAQGDQSVFR
ncbi:RNA-directed DNA polymerase, eukaryota [Tanacetum coccineum]